MLCGDAGVHFEPLSTGWNDQDSSGTTYPASTVGRFRGVSRACTACKCSPSSSSSWILNFHRRQLIVARQVNEANITTADAVAVSSLGNTSFGARTANHMAHYGEVVACVYTKNIGALLAAEEKYQAAVNKRDEIRAYRAKLAAVEAETRGTGREDQRPFGYTLTRLRKRLSVFCSTTSCAAPGREAHLRKLEVLVKERRAKCVEAARVPVKNVGEAFVTFNYEQHLNNCFEDHRRPLREKTLTRFFPKWKIGAPKFRGKTLTVEAPPEPSDVLWANYGQSREKRLAKNALAFLGMLAALFAGVGLQIYFQQIRDAARVEAYDARYTLAPREPRRSETRRRFRPDHGLLVRDRRSERVFDVHRERAEHLAAVQHPSEFEASLMLKLTVVHVINSISSPAFELPPGELVPSGTDPERPGSEPPTGKALMAGSSDASGTPPAA